jgi:hypothetical protein
MNRIKEKILGDLKAMGYNARQVSIKDRPGGLETALKITIRDPQVSYSAIEEIKQRYTSISRDEKTFEILGGGNTYIDIVLSDEVRQIWSDHYLSKVEAAIGQIKEDNKWVAIDERFSIFRERGNVYRVRDEYAGWLNIYYSRPMGIALDLYVLDVKLQEKIPQDFVFKYWSRRFWADKGIWRTSEGARDTATMVKDTAQHFQCKTEQGDSPKEKCISEWIGEFFTIYPAFAGDDGSIYAGH